MPAQNAALRTADEIHDQVLLSPRVLDRTAFEEFAGALRSLIEDAAAQARAVEAAAGRAEQTRAVLTEHGPALETRITAAGAALAAAEARSLEAQALLARAAQHLAQAQSFERRIDQLVQDRFAAVEARLGELLQRHTERIRIPLDAAAERAAGAVASLIQGIESAQRRAAELEARVEAIGPRIESLAGGAAGLAEGCDRAAALLGAADQAAAGLNSAVTGAEDVRASLSQGVLDGIGTIARAEGTRDALRAEVAILTDRIRAMQGELAGVVREAREAAAAELKPAKPARRRAAKPGPAGKKSRRE